MKKPNVKVFSSILAATLATTALAACTTDQQTTTTDEKKVVTVWAWDKNFNIAVMEEAAKIYEANNENIDIQIVDYARADVETKMHTNLSTGTTKNLPDIVLVEDYTAQKFLAAYPGMFKDLTNDINYEDFAAYKVSPMTVDGQTYGVPFDSGVAGLFYRTDYFAEAGYTSEDLQNITWQDYLEMGKKVQEVTGKYLGGYDLNETSGLSRIMMQSAGDWYFASDGTVNIENNDALKEAFSIFQAMKNDGTIKSTNGWEEWVAAMNDGSVASVVTGAWIMPSIAAAEDQAGKWAVAPIPSLSTVDSVNASNLGGSSWYVMDGKDNTDIAVDFLKSTFASDENFYQTILTNIGAIGTYLPSQGGEAYETESEFFSNQKIYSDFSQWMQEIPSVNYGVYVSEADKALDSSMSQLLSGGNIDEILKNIQSQVENQIN
ncbi:MAG: extracellular solute-binding protein [Culicoidibacterales bacterium]